MLTAYCLKLKAKAMSLENTISEAIKTAMRAKDKVALDSLRAVKSQILLLKTEARGAEVSPEQEIAIVQRMIKQRKDSYEQFSAQGRNDLAEVEEAQMKIIEQFLPKQLSSEELEAEMKKIIADTGAESMKDLGKVMGVASKAFAGKSDGKSISEMAKKLLS
ncbi:hypothetical protein SAMN05421664_1668 [Chryseobacterium soldanellicola]|uniref:Glutamyl-tRNA amidotransferase n=2 Tax=Chryseobacterium soldanellicola TaxID=311333 RepID=A0A1H1B0W6_9FLAO|nr:hypothetical protein SAMN05421664_1668 [Chryseobacterium soldanellicola]